MVDSGNTQDKGARLDVAPSAMSLANINKSKQVPLALSLHLVNDFIILLL